MACKAVEDIIIKPKLDKAFDDGKKSVFKNMIKDGMPRELAQKYAEISDQLVEMALAEM